jgi:virginiamycin B lyase
MKRSFAAAAVVLMVAGCGSATKKASNPASTTRRSDAIQRVRTGGNPCGVASAGGHVWVSDAKSAALWRIDGGTVTKAATLDPTPCAITAAYGSLWVITQSGKLDRVNPGTGRVVARIPVGDTSYQALATPGAIWVSNRNGASLTRVDPHTDRVTLTLPLPGTLPGGMAYTAGTLWIGDDDSASSQLMRLDLATRKVTRVRAGTRPAYLTAAAGKVWVSNQVDGTVSRIDPATGKVDATVPAGTSPVNLGTLDGPRPEVWVPDDQGNQLTRIDATTAKVVQTLPTGDGSGPAIVAAVAGDVWVSMFEAGEVWQVHPQAR